MRRSILTAVALTTLVAGTAYAADGAVNSAAEAQAKEDQKDDLPAKCTLREIQASHDEPANIDPQITRLRLYFEKAPFNAWKQFHLLTTKEFTLQDEKSQSIDLANGRKAEVTYTDHMTRADGKHRLRLRVQVTHGEKRVMDTTFVLDEGGVMLQAVQGKTHLLVLAVSCETH